jgi:hypothetical protein
MAPSFSTSSLPATSSHIAKSAHTRSPRSHKDIRRTGSSSSSSTSVVDQREDDDAWRCGSDEEVSTTQHDATLTRPASRGKGPAGLSGTAHGARTASHGGFWDFAFGKDKGKSAHDSETLYYSQLEDIGPAEGSSSTSLPKDPDGSASSAQSTSVNMSERPHTPTSASWVQVMPAGTGQSVEEVEPITIDGRRRTSTSKNEMARAVREDIDDLVNGKGQTCARRHHAFNLTELGSQNRRRRCGVYEFPNQGHLLSATTKNHLLGP